MVIFVFSSIHLAGYLHNLFKQIFDIWVGNEFISFENGMWRFLSQDYEILWPNVLEKQLVEHLNSQKSESLARNNNIFGLLREYLSVLCGLCFQIQLRKLYHAQTHTHKHTLTNTYTHTHTNTHTHKHAQTHTHTHTHAPTSKINVLGLCLSHTIGCRQAETKSNIKMDENIDYIFIDYLFEKQSCVDGD